VTVHAIAVLDVGKTNIKLLAISRPGEVLASMSTQATTGSGVLDVTPVNAWLRDGLSQLASQYRIDALVPTTHGAAAALVGNDSLAHPVIDYEATPPADIDLAYDAIRPAFAETFSPRLPAGLNLGRQLFWVQRRRPQAWRETGAILTYPQYWAWRLTAVLASEVTSLGCHTDLWQPAAGKMSSLVEREGWSALFPPLRPAWERLGRLRPNWSASALDCDVLCGIHDSNAAYLRYLASVEPPFVVVSTGTWVVCFNSAGQLSALDPVRDTLANVDALGRPVACSRFMGGREYAAIAGPSGLGIAPDDSDLKAVIERRLFALPSFAQTGGPYPGTKGTRIGSPRTPGEAAALATIYVALMTRESIRLTGSVRRVYIDGPFASNAAFCSVLAALMPDVEIWASEGIDGTAIGASLLASWRGDDTPPHMPMPLRRIEPAPLALDAYEREWLDRVR
jgi:sugar (pentulose or hexulose) kinase